MVVPVTDPSDRLEGLADAPPSAVLEAEAELANLLESERERYAEAVTLFRRVANDVPERASRHTQLLTAGFEAAKRDPHVAAGVVQILKQNPIVARAHDEAPTLAAAVVAGESDGITESERRAAVDALVAVSEECPEAIDGATLQMSLSSSLVERSPYVRRRVAKATATATNETAPGDARVDDLHDMLLSTLGWEPVDKIREWLAQSLDNIVADERPESDRDEPVTEIDLGATPVDRVTLDAYANVLEDASTEVEEARIAGVVSAIAAVNSAKLTAHAPLVNAVLTSYREGSVNVRGQLKGAMDRIARTVIIGAGQPDAWPKAVVEPFVDDILAVRERHRKNGQRWLNRVELVGWVCESVLGMAPRGENVDAILTGQSVTALDIDTGGILPPVSNGDVDELDATVAAVVAAIVTEDVPEDRADTAVGTLAAIAERQPEMVKPAIPWLVQARPLEVDGQVEPPLKRVLEQGREEVRGPLLESVVDAIRDGAKHERKAAVILLRELASSDDIAFGIGPARPSNVGPNLQGDASEVKEVLGDLTRVATEDPEAVAPLVGDVIGVLSTDEDAREWREARQEAAGLLKSIAEDSPETLAPVAERIEKLLVSVDHDTGNMVATGLAVLEAGQPGTLSDEGLCRIVEYGEGRDLAEKLAVAGADTAAADLMAAAETVVLIAHEQEIRDNKVLRQLEALLDQLERRHLETPSDGIDRARMEYLTALILWELSQVTPGTISDRVSLLRHLVEDATAPKARVIACEVVCEIAVEQPGAVAELTDALLRTAHSVGDVEPTVDNLGSLALRWEGESPTLEGAEP